MENLKKIVKMHDKFGMMIFTNYFSSKLQERKKNSQIETIMK